MYKTFYSRLNDTIHRKTQTNFLEIVPLTIRKVRSMSFTAEYFPGTRRIFFTLSGMPEESSQKSDGVLLDVRTPQKYASGHIPGSVNDPISHLAEAVRKYTDHNTPMFMCCQSGARSGQSASCLTKMGGRSAENIGGISSCQGSLDEPT